MFNDQHPVIWLNVAWLLAGILAVILIFDLIYWRKQIRPHAKKISKVYELINKEFFGDQIGILYDFFPKFLKGYINPALFERTNWKMISNSFAYKALLEKLREYLERQWMTENASGDRAHNYMHVVTCINSAAEKRRRQIFGAADSEDGWLYMTSLSELCRRKRPMTKLLFESFVANRDVREIIGLLHDQRYFTNKDLRQCLFLDELHLVAFQKLEEQIKLLVPESLAKKVIQEQLYKLDEITKIYHGTGKMLKLWDSFNMQCMKEPVV